MPKAIRTIPDLRRAAPDLLAWQRLVARHHQPSRRRFRNDQQIDADFAVLIAHSQAAWAGSSDLRVLSAIAAFWRFPSGDPFYREEYRGLLAARGSSAMDDRAVAHLIRASLAAN